MGGKLSREGKILMDHQAYILEMARDGELSLHGDKDIGGGFVCSHKGVDNLARKLLKILSSEFGVPDFDIFVAARKVDFPENIIEPALVISEDDGDFNDWLYHQGLSAIVTETPDKGTSLKK